MPDRWTIKEPDAGPLVVVGPRLGEGTPKIDGVRGIEVVRAELQPGDSPPDRHADRRAQAAKIDFTGKTLIDRSFSGRRQEIYVHRRTSAGEEGGTGGYWVTVSEEGKRDDYCIWEAWWLLDLREVDGEEARESAAPGHG